jgi:hypothetical protein
MLFFKYAAEIYVLVFSVEFVSDIITEANLNFSSLF